MLRITLAACVIALGSAMELAPDEVTGYGWWDGVGCERQWCLNATQDWRVKCGWDKCKTCSQFCGEKNSRTYLTSDVKDTCHPWWDIVYGERTPYYPHTDAMAKKLAWFDRLADRRGLQYSLAYGTLLGQVRHEKFGCHTCFVPYDLDVDIWVSKRTVAKLLKLAQNPHVKHVVFSRNLTKDSDPLLHSVQTLVMYPLHLVNPMSKKYDHGRKAPRWSCTGEKEWEQNTDCSFHEPIGRIINHRFGYIDMFSYYTGGPSVDNGGCYSFKHGNIEGYHCTNANWKQATPFPETVSVKCNNVTTKRIKDDQLVHDLMRSLYRENYMKPMRKWIDYKWQDVRDWREWVHHN